VFGRDPFLRIFFLLWGAGHLGYVGDESVDYPLGANITIKFVPMKKEPI
jgi:hypothetical protein